MINHVWLGIKLNDGMHMIVSRAIKLDGWDTHELHPEKPYLNTIWMLSKEQTNQALLLLSLGMGKDEIEEILNAKPTNN